MTRLAARKYAAAVVNCPRVHAPLALALSDESGRRIRFRTKGSEVNSSHNEVSVPTDRAAVRLGARVAHEGDWHDEFSATNDR